MRQRARNFRSNQTDAERLLWRQLRNRELMGEKFRRQHIVGPYIVDFVCHAKRLIVELDGGQHAEQQAYDGARTLFLESRGFRVARFWNNDVLANMEGVLQVISELLFSPPHPSPLPHCVGERERVSMQETLSPRHTQTQLLPAYRVTEKKREHVLMQETLSPRSTQAQLLLAYRVTEKRERVSMQETLSPRSTQAQLLPAYRVTEQREHVLMQETLSTRSTQVHLPPLPHHVGERAGVRGS